jgi:hypothetical protein
MSQQFCIYSSALSTEVCEKRVLATRLDVWFDDISADPPQALHKQLVGSGRACAPVRCAHPSFSAHCHANRGAARPVPAHRGFSKIYKIYQTWAAHVKGFFLSTGPHAACRGYEI